MTDRRQFLTSAAALAVLASSRSASAALSQQADGGQAPLRRLLDGVFDEMMRRDPAIATGLGRDMGERRALRSRLKMSGPGERLGSQQALVDALPRLRSFDRRGLRGTEPYYLDTMIWAAERAADLGATGFGTVDNWPTPYVLNQITGGYQCEDRSARRTAIAGMKNAIDGTGCPRSGQEAPCRQTARRSRRCALRSLPAMPMVLRSA